jgi:iron complex outermembrane recepter protein
MLRASLGTMTAALLMGASSTIALTAAGAQVTANDASTLTAAPVAPTAATPAAPNTAPPDTVGLGDIVVTAQKRATSLQKTPIAITAVEGDTLQKAQIHTLTEVKNLVPAMQMGDNSGYAQITIRGIGISAFVPGAESAVALNVNEAYVSRPIAQLTGLYDVSSLEALRGPQGTLFGRNATAGAINITTTRPTDTWSGYGRVTVGNYAAVNAEGAVGGPIISDTLLFRIAGFIDKHDGYGRNLVTGNPVDDMDSRGVRGTLLFKPTSSIKATIIADYFKESDHNAALHYFGATGLTGLPGATGIAPTFITQGGYAPTNIQDMAAGTDSKFRLRTSSVTGILEWASGPFGLKSITAYRDQNSLSLTPLDGGSTNNAFYLSGEPAHQFSEELQAHYDTRRLHLTGGLYYFHEFDSSSPGVAAFKYSVLSGAFGLPPIPASQDYFVNFVQIGGRIRTTAKAVFGEASYEILDGLTLTGGLRYSNEKKTDQPQNAISLTQPFFFGIPQPPINYTLSKTFNSTTPKLGIQYQLTPKTLVYATYAKGFKSGGFDITTAAPAFAPEKLTDIEGGIKTTLFDNKLRLALSGFHYDYSNLQVLQVIGTQEITTNAGSAKIYGGELEATALLTPSLQINGAASWLHARYSHYIGPSAAQPLFASFDFAGKRLNNAPDFSGNIGATYTWELTKGSLALRGTAEYTTKFYFSPDNIDILGQNGFVKGDAFLTYTSVANWHVTGFVRNISNINTKVSGVVNSPLIGSPARGGVSPPRTFGVEVGYKF